MVQKRTFTVHLVSKARKWNDIDLEIVGPITPATIYDALNRLKSLRKDPKVCYYDRVTFDWEDHQINLTNPGYDGQDPKPYFESTSEGYKWTKQFLGDYFKEQPKEEEPKKEPEKQKEPDKKDGPWIVEPGMDNPSRLTPLPANDNPRFSSRDYFEFRNPQQNWQQRWDKMMARSQELEKDDIARRLQLYKKVQPAYQAINNLITGQVPVTDFPKTIYTLMANMASLAVHVVRSLPLEIRAAAGRFANNIDFIGLSIERLYVILSTIMEAIGNVYKLMSQLDWEGAGQLLNKWIADQQKTLDYGIESGVLDEDGSIMGPENWKLPNTPPNSPEEFKKWLAISGLMNSPFIGKIVQDQARFEVLRQYMERTGVGIPDDYAWMKFILGNQIGVTVPMQEAMDTAGQIPDWFLGRTRELTKIGKDIHEATHHELKELEH